MRFEFATANRSIFGPGALSQVGPAAAGMGRRALLAAGAASPHVVSLIDRLAQAGMEAVRFPVQGEPTVESVQQAVALAAQQSCDLVIGLGGGSALDTAKAVAALRANPGQALDYLEVVGRGQVLTHPPLPCIAIPTTAGTGSEVTRNAVLDAALPGRPGQRVKASLRSPLMLPRLALVDPELTYSLPPAVTANTGLDALTQLIEPFTSSQANPLTGALCREGLVRAGRSLRQAYLHGDDPSAREDMSLASLLGGLALANSKLGAVHGFAGVLGGILPAPHGAICAALLPHVMEINLRALRQRQPDSPILDRYAEAAFTRCPGRPGSAASNTALRVTSEPVPAVVGMAMQGSGGWVRTCPRP
ncbi:MAG TPA: iron-containing alcohol dehydrogenase, partial [Anaerolineales bacterium]